MNVQKLLQGEYMARIIGVVSGKGGVGKTVTSANLGSAMARYFDKRVIVVDTNITTPHLGIQLGMYPFDISLNDVLKSSKSIEEAIYEHDSSGMKTVLSSLVLGDMVNLDVNKVKKSIHELDEYADIILLDSAPGLGREGLLTLKTANELLIVVNPNIPSVTDAFKIIKIAKKNNKNIIGMIVNRVGETKYELKPEKIEEIAQIPVIATIPEDKNIPKSIAKKTPIVMMDRKSPASKGFLSLCEEVLGEGYYPPRMNVFEKFMGFFRNKFKNN